MDPVQSLWRFQNLVWNGFFKNPTLLISNNFLHNDNGNIHTLNVDLWQTSVRCNIGIDLNLHLLIIKLSSKGANFGLL